VLEGELAALDPVTGQRYGEATLGPGQFFGEISFLWGGALMLGAEAVRDTTPSDGGREAMLDLMSRIPEMSDIVITVFAARRRRLLESGRASLTLIGAEVDRTIRSIAGFAGRNRIPFRSLTLDEAEAEALANACSIAPQRARRDLREGRRRFPSPRPARSPRASGSTWISTPRPGTTC
jgi:thioredoxin reductase (NADPH)